MRRKRLEDARQQVDLLRTMLNAHTLPCFERAGALLQEALGNPERESLEVESEWREVIQEFNRIRALQSDFDTICKVTSEIESCGAPLWAKQLRDAPALESEQDLLPTDWAAAWKWRRQFGYLVSIDGRSRIQDLGKSRITLQSDLSNAYASLVEQLTWLKLKETLDKDRGLMQSLQLYMAAVAQIRGGTGPMAPFYRRRAKEAMSKAYESVRCWIMPHWRVSESLPSELGIFDLVIVDEASQSDLWALPAMLRAKKLLVVGDDKQVSPSAVGMASAKVIQLYNTHLRTLPFGSVLTPKDSVYGLASAMFASDLVRLREHFRCVEPIIEFSNRLCYNGEIRCLRIPTASERITPPLVDVFVRDGAREGKSKVNRIEAQAIVDEIKILTNDPRYSGRTIGVVSLLGNEQPKYIFELLIAQLGEEKIIAHKIRCGDAMTFQGREADIIFISMVSDGDSLRALSGEMYEQRFNVAVSRAKDRLYLFHSFHREDLKEHDLRSQLLNHFQNPLRRDVQKKGRELCESDFERAMYDRLNTEGYRVIPQVSAGGFRIDLVVEGAAGRRLAIECDGDQYHGPEMWVSDLQRQRTLERAGWTFWRCWGSSFLRDQDACMTDLFGVLKSHGIEPIGAMDADLSDVVEYREVGGAAENGESNEPLPVAGDSVPTEHPRQEAQTLPAGHSQPPIQQSLLPTEAGLPLWTQPQVPVVEIRDSIRYCFTDDVEDIAFVTLVDERSNPNLGTINRDTVIGRVLQGMVVGEEREVPLPMGRRQLRVIEILKPTNH